MYPTPSSSEATMRNARVSFPSRGNESGPTLRTETSSSSISSSAVQRAAASRASRLNAAKCPTEPATIGRPWLDQVGSIVENIDEDLVVGREQIVKELVDRGLCGVELVAGHAAARVEHDPEADGDPFGTEMRNRLRAAVFEDGEVVFAEAGHEPPVTVADRCRHVHELDAGPELERILGRLPIPLLSAQRGRRHGNDTNNRDEPPSEPS